MNVLVINVAISPSSLKSRYTIDFSIEISTTSKCIKAISFPLSQTNFTKKIFPKNLVTYITLAHYAMRARAGA